MSSKDIDGYGIFALSEVKVDQSVLQTMTEGELERLTITMLKLHRRCGHPGRQAFLRTLKARGADAKTLAVADQLRCPECAEGQLRKPPNVVLLEKEDKLWNTVQMDAFHFRYGDQVHHFLVFLDEASAFVVTAEMMVHPASEGENPNTEQVIETLEKAWVQYFGCPAKVRCDLEGAFRGRALENYMAERGIELLHVPAEHHEATGDVERTIGELRRKMEAFLRHEASEKKGGLRHDGCSQPYGKGWRLFPCSMDFWKRGFWVRQSAQPDGKC